MGRLLEAAGLSSAPLKRVWTTKTKDGQGPWEVSISSADGVVAVSTWDLRGRLNRAAAEVLPYPLFGGFLDLETESPRPTQALAATELPDDDSEGPHFFYGLQWWFFGFLAIFGFGYLAYDEWRQARGARATSEGAEHAPVDGEHHAGDEG